MVICDNQKLILCLSDNYTWTICLRLLCWCLILILTISIEEIKEIRTTVWCTGNFNYICYRNNLRQALCRQIWIISKGRCHNIRCCLILWKIHCGCCLNGIFRVLSQKWSAPEASANNCNTCKNCCCLVQISSWLILSSLLSISFIFIIAVIIKIGFWIHHSRTSYIISLTFSLALFLCYVYILSMICV